MDIPIYNDTMKQGADWALSLEYLDANGNAIDLTGYSADCEIRDKTTGQLLETPTIAALGSSGIVALSLTAAKTALIPAVAAMYDVFIILGAVKVCLVEGDIDIHAMVTQ